MRLTLVNEKIIGEKVANPIYSSNGMLQVSKGALISEKILSYIRKIGMSTLYIEDGNNSIQLEEVLESSIQMKLIKSLKEEFKAVKKNKILDYFLIKEVVTEIIENINVSENAHMYNGLETTEETEKLVLHSFNVAVISIMTGLQLKISMDKLLSLGIGALLHDIGYLFADGEQHTTEGYNFLRKNPNIMPTAFICSLQHHENSNGTGFPRKLKENEIYELAKIVSVCNRYANLLSEDKVLPHEAIEIIIAESSDKFNNEIVRTFSQSTICYPNGLNVVLNDKTEGIIVKQNKGFPQRPVIQTYQNDKHEYINLLEELTLFINTVKL